MRKKYTSSTRRLASSMPIRESADDRADRLRKEDEYTKEADAAHEASNRDQAEYDKQILTLSTGLLALLIAFIKDIIPLAHARFRGLLYFSYLLFGLAIVMVLFSFQFSIAGNARASSDPVFPYMFARQVTFLNWGCGAIFVLALIFSSIFVAINVQIQADSTSEKITMEMKGGQYMKPPSPSTIVEKGQTMKAPPPPPPPPPAQSSQTTSNSNSGAKK